MSQDQIAGLHVNWVETGSPDAGTVVLLHPVGMDLTYWDRQIDALRGKYRVAALDAPGHGRSGGGPEDCGFGRMVEVVAALIERVGGPVHLAGLSWGGMLAQAVVLARPDLVRSLLLLGTACTFAQPVREGMRVRAKTAREQGMAALVDSSLARWFTAGTLLERPHLIDRVVKTVLGDDARVHAAIWEAISEFEVEERLAEIQCPTMILVGELDPSTPPAAAEVMRVRIAGARVEVLPGVSHFLQLEAADAVSAAMLQFVDEQK